MSLEMHCQVVGGLPAAPGAETRRGIPYNTLHLSQLPRRVAGCLSSSEWLVGAPQVFWTSDLTFITAFPWLGPSSWGIRAPRCWWQDASGPQHPPPLFFYTASPEKYLVFLGSWSLPYIWIILCSYSQWLDFSFCAINWCTGMIWLVLCMLGMGDICENMPSLSSQTHHTGVFTPLLSHNRGRGKE